MGRRVEFCVERRRVGIGLFVVRGAEDDGVWWANKSKGMCTMLDLPVNSPVVRRIYPYVYRLNYSTP